MNMKKKKKKESKREAGWAKDGKLGYVNILYAETEQKKKKKDKRKHFILNIFAFVISYLNIIHVGQETKIKRDKERNERTKEKCSKRVNKMDNLHVQRTLISINAIGNALIVTVTEVS